MNLQIRLTNEDDAYDKLYISIDDQFFHISKEFIYV